MDSLWQYGLTGIDISKAYNSSLQIPYHHSTELMVRLLHALAAADG